MILVIDNYDSFSYNLVQMLGEIVKESKGREHLGEIKVVRNDQITIEEIRGLAPTHIILSPGPGKPSEAGICEKVIQELAGEAKILGVCLGHQAICEVYGATITYAKCLMHGKQSLISLDLDSKIFQGLSSTEVVGRYHSLAACPESMPKTLKVIAKDSEGEIMAVKHKEYEVYGLQFHPESVLTPHGKQMVINFLM